MGMRSLNGESDRKGKMKEKLRLAVFGHKRWSREGGVDIVVQLSRQKSKLFIMN